MEMNPHHQTLQSLREHWHVIIALLIVKHGELAAGGRRELVITQNDFLAFPKDACVTVQELHDGLHLRLVSAEEGMRIAKREGGLPT